MVSPTPFRMAEFKSNFGPKYSYQPNLAGFTIQQAFRLGTRTAFYGAPAVVAALLFASGIPRVQRDILQQIPVIGGYFVKEVHASDNPF
ncbi:Fc.00g092540.m01.CDS01 [Cosmosporella sp. VM-42]